MANTPIVGETLAAEGGGGSCVTCGAELRGPYCHACGEKARSPDDLRVAAFARRALGGAFDLDSRFWRTFRTLLARPGLLTAEFVAGRRRPYLHPLQVFLLANLVFFAMLGTLGGFNTFTTTLDVHLGQPLYGEVAQRLVDARVAPGSGAAALYAARFDEATPRYANSMVILTVPIFAALFALLYPRRRAFVPHVVFGLHFMALLLLVVSVLPLALRLLVMIAPGAIGPLTRSELPVALVLATCLLLWLVPALHRAYGDGPTAAAARAIGAVLLILPTLLIYRAVLFFAVYLMVD